MQALILAAGFGKRLQPVTNTLPKSLVEVNGVPLLVNALRNLKACGIMTAIIVTGHMADKVSSTIGSEFEGMTITYVENEEYKNTNNVYSFYLAKDYIKDDILMLECDLFYRKNLIETILSGTAECNILVSPYDEATMDGTVILADENDNAKSLIIKKCQDENFDYTNMKKTVNVYKFSYNFIARKLMPAVETYIKTQSVNSYYELVLGSLIYYGNDDIKTVNIDKSTWCEIDNIEDLRYAEKVFASEVL